MMMRRLLAVALCAGIWLGLAGFHKDDKGPRVHPGSPAVSACGAGPSVVPGSNNSVGIINTGTGTVTGCTMTFTPAWPTAPICVVSPSAAIGAGITTNTATTLTIALAVSLPGGRVTYHCFSP